MFKNHPRGLPVLFFTEMWERFGFYLMLGIFFLYMTAGVDPLLARDMLFAIVREGFPGFRHFKQHIAMLGLRK